MIWHYIVIFTLTSPPLTFIISPFIVADWLQRLMRVGVRSTQIGYKVSWELVWDLHRLTTGSRESWCQIYTDWLQVLLRVGVRSTKFNYKFSWELVSDLHRLIIKSPEMYITSGKEGLVVFCLNVGDIHPDRLKYTVRAILQQLLNSRP